MANRYVSIAALALTTLAVHGLAVQAAETVTRKREKPLSGEVTEVNRTEVIVKVKSPRDETIRVPANDVLGISWTGEPPDANLARSDDAGGKYQRALDGYQKSLQASKATNPLSKIDLEYGIARATARLALAEDSKIDEAIKKLEEFRSRQPEHYRYYEAMGLLGQLYLAKKDFVKAKSAFDVLAKAPWKESQWAAKIATGKLLLADNHPDEAIAAFDAVIGEAAEGRTEESQRQEALLAKSQILISQQKYDDAHQLLRKLIDDPNADDPRVMAEAFVRSGDCLREQGKNKDAILEYLRVPLLFSSEKSLQAEALFQLARLFEKVGDKVKAADMREKLEGDEFKNTEWARQLKSPPAG